MLSLGVLVFWLVAATVSCKTVDPVIVIRPNEACLSSPPPKPKPVDYYEGQYDGGCAYVSCLDSAGATALGDNLAASSRWQSEAWTRCGPEDAGR